MFCEIPPQFLARLFSLRFSASSCAFCIPSLPLPSSTRRTSPSLCHSRSQFLSSDCIHGIHTCHNPACFPSCPFAPPFSLFLPDDLQQSHRKKTQAGRERERERERVFARTLVRPKFRISTASFGNASSKKRYSARSLVRNFVRALLATYSRSSRKQIAED